MLKSKSKKDKKIHYDLTKKFFLESAKYKKGFYDAKDKNKLIHDKKQNKIWEISKSLIDRLLKENKILKLIDIGCGIGDFTLDLAKEYNHFSEIYGIDFLKENIDIAKKNTNKKIKFLEEDLKKLSFKDKYFDLSICINVLHHIHIDDIKEAVSEIARVSEKFIILEIRNRKNIFNFWFEYIALPLFYKNLPVYSYSINEINMIMEKNNFNFCQAKGIYPKTCLCRRLILLYERQK